MKFKVWLIKEGGFYSGKYDFPYDTGGKYEPEKEHEYFKMAPPGFEKVRYDKSTDKWEGLKRRKTEKQWTPYEDDLGIGGGGGRVVEKAVGPERWIGVDPGHMQQWMQEPYAGTPLAGEEKDDGYGHPMYDPDEPDYYDPQADDRKPDNWYDDGRNWESGEWKGSEDYLRGVGNDKWLKGDDPNTFTSDEFERDIKPALNKTFFFSL